MHTECMSVQVATAERGTLWRASAASHHADDMPYWNKHRCHTIDMEPWQPGMPYVLAHIWPHATAPPKQRPVHAPHERHDNRSSVIMIIVCCQAGACCGSVPTGSIDASATHPAFFTPPCQAAKPVRRRAGHRVCLVSSGAVGMGCQVLAITERPAELAKKQALAAVGQGALLRLYHDLFSSLSLVRPLSLTCFSIVPPRMPWSSPPYRGVGPLPRCPRL